MNHKIKTLEEVNLSNNFLFSKTMEDKNICKRVLEEILQIKIKEIKIPETEKTIKTSLFGKGIRLDVYVEDELNTIYNIEMQTTNNANLGKRSRFYQGLIDSILIQQGEDFDKLNKTFIIFICTFDPFKKGRHLYTFESICKQVPELVLNNESTVLFLNPHSRLDDVSHDLKGFLRYVEHSTDEMIKECDSVLVRDVAQRVQEVKENKYMRRDFMTLEMQIREERKQAKEEARNEEKISNAKALLDLLDDKTISERLNIPLEQVKELRKNLRI